MHRTIRTKLVLDTVVNSDTLFGRIKLYLLQKYIDIELSNSNFLSVPYSYVRTIVGRSPKYVPLTTWIILTPNTHSADGYLRRLILKKDSVAIYDSSKKDTLESEIVGPITLDNGHEKINIFYPFCSTHKTLRKFIKKRYGAKLDASTKENNDDHFLISYLINEELYFNERR